MSRNYYAVVGDLLNCITIVVNLVLTSTAMIGLPKNPTLFDDWWTGSGFCISQQPERVFDTEIICSLCLILSAFGSHLFIASKQRVLKEDRQLLHKLKGGVFANLGHGVGHLFLYMLGIAPPKMHLGWSLDGIGNALVTLCFFVGVFRAILVSLSLSSITILACLVILFQVLLDVPGGLAFTYSQSVILVAGAVDQMLLPKKGRTYAVVAGSFVPLLALYMLEMTQCRQLLSWFGGHAVYDVYLSVLPFLLFYGIQHLDGKKSKTQ